MMTDPATPNSTATPAELDEKVAGLSYEEARSRLVEIVAQLEQGALPLEESLALWEVGEALARRCQAWLDGARERLAAAGASAPQADESTTSSSGTESSPEDES
jgi:exodeoxyribonuclease VII small subunit